MCRPTSRVRESGLRALLAACLVAVAAVTVWSSPAHAVAPVCTQGGIAGITVPATVPGSVFKGTASIYGRRVEMFRGRADQNYRWWAKLTDNPNVTTLPYPGDSVWINYVRERPSDPTYCGYFTVQTVNTTVFTKGVASFAGYHYQACLSVRYPPPGQPASACTGWYRS